MHRNKDVIKHWMKRIEKSNISVASFFAQHKVPFSRAQYFRYKKDLDSKNALKSPLRRGGNQKIDERAELFLRGCHGDGALPSVNSLCDRLENELSISVNRTTMWRALNRLFPELQRSRLGSSKKLTIKNNSLGGFELIIAVAYHLKWPERAGKIIAEAVVDLKRKQRHSLSARPDVKGRTIGGCFTRRYNRRTDVRFNRFASVSDKRRSKNWRSMNIMQNQIDIFARKSLAILALPIVTSNGTVRSVNLALGQTLDNFCGFNYKQATLNKFLAELKYLGIADRLLLDLPQFWQKCWGPDISKMNGPILCYYVDGNTKAVWSSKRVKQNKVTMLGRVMGCLEQVFIHDGLGHPVYFETYSGRAPVGEYVLTLFEKIESMILDVPGSKTSVCRAIVMDAASNSVGTLRTFAAQNKYHYITTLDDNQWSERRIRSRSYPIRYQYGEATLRDLDFELEDSHEKGYLIIARAIKINWDNGKQTVILTSLPRVIVDASEVVYSYFRRWPAQELPFRSKKAAVSLNMVSGYGKKLVTNERVKNTLDKLKVKKERLECKLREPMATIVDHDKALATLVSQDRLLRQKTTIRNGQRIVPRNIREQFTEITEKIRLRERAKKEIEKEHAKDFKSYRKTQKEWLRLQSKTTVYQLDVELDQILTYHRASLAHLCAYFIKHFLDGEPMTLIMLFHRVAQLPAQIEESKNERKVIIRMNRQDVTMMDTLERAMGKINKLKIKGHGNKIYRFELEPISLIKRNTVLN